MESDRIDDSLYSRQRYMLGDNAMVRLAQANVLICGVDGLGVEIAKNVVLAGVKSVTLQDWVITSYKDLGAQFYLTEADVEHKRNRGEASCKKLAELNPYVKVQTLTHPLENSTDLGYLDNYQCVVLCGLPMQENIRVDEYCRAHEPPIKFICGAVYGVCCSAFCDFGADFEVTDQDGEEPKEIFVCTITKENPGIVSTFDKRPHGLETDCWVTFKEVRGMSEVNGKNFQIKVTSPYQFEIGDTSAFTTYTDGGLVTQVKIPKIINFVSLKDQVLNPGLLTTDFSKMTAPVNIHLAYVALHQFELLQKRLPDVRSEADALVFISLAKEINKSHLNDLVQNIDTAFLQMIAMTCRGQLPPLCAFLGGILAQEVLKAVTGKFTPLQQWIHTDAREVISGLEDTSFDAFQPRNDRYDCLRICVGHTVCEQLKKLNIFMVGCGAIGCEMMKNYALLGVGGQGQITITDNDLIEKSNLNRQFLFRSHHIRKAKSTTAAEAACGINPDLKIEAHQYKVGPETTHSVYNDAFFERQDIVINALDNLEARRYMDGRCVTNQKPLLESGTMGSKGHVQVIVPHLSESYSSQRDPEDEDIPYCTLKSFPATIEHCIQWARDKFESSFAQKPAMYNKFFSEHSDLQTIASELSQGHSIDGAVACSKLLAMKPSTWKCCVLIARLKFQKYYNHRAKQLLHAFPLDTKLKDGSYFWSSPKRPPMVVEFDAENDLHMGFILSCGRLYANICGVQWPADISKAEVMEQLARVKIPTFIPGSKRIETDESAKKPEGEEITEDTLGEAAKILKTARTPLSSMFTLSFEKDDNSNGHIDFITSASNLRASMYGIDSADRLKTKKIAGRIVPAIATTTAAVAGLVALELIKLVGKRALDDYKSCFLNLALPVVLFSEPGAAAKSTLSNGVTYSQWDRWEVSADGAAMTLNQFISTMQAKFGLEVSMIVQGSRMVYVPMMPAHHKRLPQPMSKLVKPAPGQNYVDLHVSYLRPQSSQGDEEDQMGPPVRYKL